MSNQDIKAQLGGRERQIVEAVYRLGKATVAEVRTAIPDPPSYSAIRAMLNLLESKGHLRHEQDGIRYVYLPVVTQKKAQRSALKHLVRTFFSGSPIDAAAALLEDARISPEERQRLFAVITGAEEEGR